MPPRGSRSRKDVEDPAALFAAGKLSLPEALALQRARDDAAIEAVKERRRRLWGPRSTESEDTHEPEHHEQDPPRDC